MIYKLMLGAICLIYLYMSNLIAINMITGIFTCLCSFALAVFFKSYGLFYTSLLCLFIISFRYYTKKKNKMTSLNLIKIFTLNLVNISFSVYGLIQIVYLYTAEFNIQKYIPLTKISVIELASIAYMLDIYLVIIILVLSINNNLTIEVRRDIHFTMLKTMITVISVVLIIIFINAVLYFLIHNFHMSSFQSPFSGNFLKDAIKSDYKYPKAFIDCLWFSATTFFTVGYGDMHPVGNIMYLLSTMEMVSAYILGMIMVPILLLKISNNTNSANWLYVNIML